MSQNDNTPPSETFDDTLAKKETALQVAATKRLHDVKTEAASDGKAEDKPPSGHLNPDG